MPPEPDRKIEELLKAYGQKRRDDAGAAFDLHAATRRLLQAEVARCGFRKAKAPRSWPGLALLFWRRVGLAVSALVLLGVITWIFLALPAGDHRMAQSKGSPTLLSRLDKGAATAPRVEEAKVATSKKDTVGENASTVDALGLAERSERQMAGRPEPEAFGARGAVRNEPTSSPKTASKASEVNRNPDVARENARSQEVAGSPDEVRLAATPGSAPLRPAAPLSPTSTMSARAASKAPPTRAVTERMIGAATGGPGNTLASQVAPTGLAGVQAELKPLVPVESPPVRLYSQELLRDSASPTDSLTLGGGAGTGGSLAFKFGLPSTNLASANRWDANTAAPVAMRAKAAAGYSSASRMQQAAATSMGRELISGSQGTGFAYGTTLTNAIQGALGERFSRLGISFVAKPRGTNVNEQRLLASFEIEQAGDQIRLVDSDGSIYEGRLEPMTTKRGTDLDSDQLGRKGIQKVEEAATQPLAQELWYPEFAEGQHQFYSFHVSGTSRSLGQLVVIQGTLESGLEPPPLAGTEGPEAASVPTRATAAPRAPVAAPAPLLARRAIAPASVSNKPAAAPAGTGGSSSNLLSVALPQRILGKALINGTNELRIDAVRAKR